MCHPILKAGSLFTRKGIRETCQMDILVVHLNGTKTAIARPMILFSRMLIMMSISVAITGNADIGEPTDPERINVSAEEMLFQP